MFQPDMALAMDVWLHMTAQGVQPSPEEYVHMITGWAAAGELRRRVADGVVEEFLRQLGGMAFELEPMDCCSEAAAAVSASSSSCDEFSGTGGKGAGIIIAQLCVSSSSPAPPPTGPIFNIRYCCINYIRKSRVISNLTTWAPPLE